MTAFQIWILIYNSATMPLSTNYVLTTIKSLQMRCLEGCGDPQDDTKPSLFSNSKSSILGLFNDVSFVSELNWKVCENRLNKIP